MALTKDQWYDIFYSEENERVLRSIRQIGYGEIKIVVHERRPVDLYPAPRIRLQKQKKKHAEDTEPV